MRVGFLMMSFVLFLFVNHDMLPVAAMRQVFDVVIAGLKEWQTLATGILAIGAAYLTVRAMFSVDMRQQARHDELVANRWRVDNLRFQRATIHLLHLIDVAERGQTLPKLGEMERERALDNGRLLGAASAFWVTQLNDSLESRYITDCIELLGPFSVSKIEAFRAGIRYLKGVGENITKSCLNSDIDRAIMYHDRLVAALPVISEQAKELSHAINEDWRNIEMMPTAHKSISRG